MDILLLIIGFLCMIIGIAGSILPVLPGASISWLGLFLLHLTSIIPFNYYLLGITFFIVLVVTVLDYIIPSKGIKHFGGSKYGVWGTNIGLVVGFFIPIPLGFLLGAFFGGLLGELVFNKSSAQQAFKAATGSLVGFLISTLFQFAVCLVYLGLFINLFWTYKTQLL